MLLTDEQKEAVSSPSNLTLSACPGSGKTRVIIAKLLHLAEELTETPRSIGCITYTNAAVDEIEQRLKQLGNHGIRNHSEVVTIHAFCLQFILRPYSWLVPEVPRNFSIITEQMSEFGRIVETVEDEFGRRLEFRSIDDYSSIRMNINGNPAGNGLAHGVVSEASARRFWEFVRGNGHLDFSMILFYSLKILRENEFVGIGIAARFQWLLVDEFQDTTDVQIEIFAQLSKHETTEFFLVGDQNQSIQGFAGARPDLAISFSRELGARQDVSLSGNFRSSKKIACLAERVISRNPAMTALGESKDYALEPQYIHAISAVEAITDHFLPLLAEHGIEVGNAAILAPWWQHLVPVARALRNFEIPVFGPGARPYKKSRLFSVLAEQLGASATSDHLLDLPGVERAIFRLINEVIGEMRFDIFSYDGRRTALTLVYEAKRLALSGIGGVEWFNSMAAASAQILVQNDWLSKTAIEALPESAAAMIVDMENNGIDTNNLQISDLGLFANPDKALKLITLHRAKGREFDAVALIHMNDGQLPHYMARSDFEIEEGRRLFYVGISRAKKVLMIVSDQSDRRNQPSRYLRECGIV